MAVAYLSPASLRSNQMTFFCQMSILIDVSTEVYDTVWLKMFYLMSPLL